MKQFSYTIQGEHGLHARCAGKLVQKAQNFTSNISIEYNQRIENLKRLFTITCLGISKGDFVTVKVEGNDETEAANVLENYFNVKKIENEKNLQISEMSLQYDYYMKQSNDMENIRKISHDIKNHLEALRGNVDYQQKQEYIDGIESKLDIYQSYYKTGNAFLDNLLHAKRLEALEKKIEFKVFADFTPFKRVKNEDLCVIVSNTIDNALRECQLMKADNPKIECLVQLKARKIKGFLSIICENSLRESQAEALRGNSVMETSKEDKKNHGFGVKNIRRVVREYGGEVSFNVVDDMFSVSILIPIEV